MFLIITPLLLRAHLGGGESLRSIVIGASERDSAHFEAA